MLWPRDPPAGQKEHVGCLGLEAAAPSQLNKDREPRLVHITNTVTINENVMVLSSGVSSFLSYPHG